MTKIFILFLVFFLYGSSSFAQSVIELDKKGFKEKVWDYEKERKWKFSGDKPVIIDLYAPWCGPCKKLAPILKDIQKELGDKIQIYKINTDKEKEISEVFQVRSIPMLLFIPKDNVPFILKGFLPKKKLMSVIRDKMGITGL